ncbi:uncharacterized protein LOC115875929 [Sitophilus oryzae]|uniref:Uncharacterized protein LOC115875929 n=1 Tax=Sitophilus oryzae TaxID=7048 RepID=A0A6J2X8T9_SITOR|nr:uncharacterized protein LOC115875929 [Sitophilus oryzae]
MKNRYLYLEKILEDCTNQARVQLIVFNKKPTHVPNKLQIFSHNFKMMYLLVDDFNAIFGNQIFFITICTALEILNGVNYGMPTLHNIDVNDDTITINVVYPILYIICNTEVVMACDAVVKSGKKISKMCFMLHEQTDNNELKEAFLKLAVYTQGLCPYFSAAGFWYVEQEVLSTLFSSVITYLIIIIQFNMTLK